MAPADEPPPPYTRHDPVAISPVISIPPTPATPTTTSSTPSTASAPSHNYSGQDQTALTIDVPSATHDNLTVPDGSPLILTPPGTPDVYTHQFNTIPGAEIAPRSSSALYFEDRPAPILRLPKGSPDQQAHRLVISPDDGPDNVRYPTPETLWKARDVSEMDWATFVNHLFPNFVNEANARLAERKLAAELARQRQDAAVGPPESSPLYEAQLDNLRGLQASVAKEQDHSGLEVQPQAENCAEPEETRRQRIETTVAEWNEGFFLPRHLKIDAIIIPYTSADVVVETRSVAETASSAPTYSETPRMTRDFNEDPGNARIASDGRQALRAAFGPFQFLRQQREPAQARGCSSSSRSTESFGFPSPRSFESGCSRGRRISRGHHGNRGQPGHQRHHHHNRHDHGSRRRSGSVSSTSTTSSASSSSSISSSLLEGLDGPDLRALRSSLASFLISLDSKQLGSDILSQRKQKVKALKREMQSFKQDLKFDLRQQKLVQHAEGFQHSRRDKRIARRERRLGEEVREKVERKVEMEMEKHSRKQAEKELKQAEKTARKDKELAEKTARKEQELIEKNARKDAEKRQKLEEKDAEKRAKLEEKLAKKGLKKASTVVDVRPEIPELSELPVRASSFTAPHGHGTTEQQIGVLSVQQ